ncbi:TIGR00269 family protein [Cuniculiplasma sp. SKW3]|uniref:TIGR00269 family protein n=1 Tax=unclassified Cuniculiplasma TaxID=2619706 RepID=UPI003FCF752C
MNCSICGKKAVYENKTGKNFLCKMHFMENVEKRFRQELRREVKFGRNGTTISVAISGGKDSSVLLYLLHKTLHMRRDVNLEAFTIDEGIKGYRSSGLESAKKLCSDLNIKHVTVSFREAFGKELDQIVAENRKMEGSPCSYCGPMRRDLMNRMSLELNADYVALGINLDDYAQSIMMNVIRGDFERMARMAPHIRIVDGLVPRITPMRKIYEKEVKLYAILAGIEHDANWCPYAMKAQRNRARELINELEEEKPGTKLAIEGFLEKLQDNIQRESVVIQKCQNCGNPANGKYCSSCIKNGFA